MGRYMTYQRFRHRNGLMFRVPDEASPYGWELLSEEQKQRFDPSAKPNANLHILVGDLNRMERDYLGKSHWGDWLLLDVAKKADVSPETVQKVLRAVFFEQGHVDLHEEET